MGIFALRLLFDVFFQKAFVTVLNAIVAALRPAINIP